VRSAAAVVVLAGMILFAYYRTESLLPILAAALLLVAVLFRAAKASLCPLDWVVLLVLLYEIPSLWASRFPANGASSARIVCAAVLLYFAARLAVGTPKHMLLVSALVGIGGVALAWIALSRFNGQYQAMQAVGFSDLVAFRSRLIVPGRQWVLGEWFTLVLSTLPFAFGVAVGFWVERRRAFAAVAALMAVFIAAALMLSCSRVIFWGVAAFAVVAGAISAACRILPIRAALVLVAVALAIVGAVVTLENAVYPGIVSAYVGRQASQTRSTEGRLTIWRRSGKVFRLSPVWGVGSGNAPLFLTPTADQEETTGFASRTYSLPIQILTEKGVIGAAFYLAVLVLAGWEARRKLRNPRVSPQMKGMTCCLAAGAVAVLFRELTYSSLLEHSATAMLFAMSLALLAAEEPA
jgi:O-antigen ligase